MTPAQCRAARGLLGWTAADLARAAGVSVIAIRGFESERPTPRRAEIAMMQRALQGAGIAFEEPEGGHTGVSLPTRRR